MKSVTNHKLLLCPKSLLSGNYKHLMYKYKLCHLDWTMSLLDDELIGKILTVPDYGKSLICNCGRTYDITICDFVQNFIIIQEMVDAICTE